MCDLSLKKGDYRFFELARREAEKSTFPRFHVGCVIVYNGYVVSAGCNSEKSAPVQKRYNRYRHFNNSESHKPINDAIHAEIQALKTIPYPVAQQIDWKKVKVYVYRISPGHNGKRGMSRSCPACMEYIRSFGIRDLYYSTDGGFAHERLEY